MHKTISALNTSPRPHMAAGSLALAASAGLYSTSVDRLGSGSVGVDSVASPLSELATGSVIAYSPAHQIACCDSLTRLGFGNIPLSRIGQYAGSAKLWCDHISDLTTDPSCQLFFPGGDMDIEHIYALARLHDSKTRPPIATLPVANLDRSLTLFSQARREHRDLSTRLSTQHYWLDTNRLPLTEQTLRNLYRILQTEHSSSSWRLHRLAIRWFKPYLQPNAVFSTQLACGNVARLARIIENTLQFEQSRGYFQALGPAFRGIHSDWDRLRAQLGFYGEVRAALGNAEHAELILSRWADHEDRFFALCRRASKVRRRIHKLNNLVRRQYNTPAESAGYLQMARKSVSRLQIWLTTLRYTSDNGNLTPIELQQILPLPKTKKLDITI